jgi:uncharacterized protein (TIGR00725 family)
MRVVADEAVRLGANVVFVIPPEYEKYSFPEGTVVVRTGLGVRERSSILVRSGDALVVLGGGVGTFFEALIACSYGIPVYYLVSPGGSLPTDRVAGCFPDGVFDSRAGCRFFYYTDPALMASELCGKLRGKKE